MPRSRAPKDGLGCASFDEVHARANLGLVEYKVSCNTYAGLELGNERLEELSRASSKDGHLLHEPLVELKAHLDLQVSREPCSDCIDINYRHTRQSDATSSERVC